MLKTLYVRQALKPEDAATLSGTAAWQSPSNIALVKYWGKHGHQLPNNPSVSLTLAEAFTRTQLLWSPKEGKTGRMLFRFHGQEEPSFAEKMKKFLESQAEVFPFLAAYDLEVESSNSFPHSSGIASSASSMSAFVLCLLDMEVRLSGQPPDEEAFSRKASWLARQASGSAARSLFPYASLWGQCDKVEGSSQETAIALTDLHPVFRTYRDSILIVHSGVKTVSSRAGHALMEGNPFAPARYAQAKANTVRLIGILKSGNLEDFVELVESEALQLHALMMASTPSFILMKPETLQIIEKLRQFRHESGLPLCFTLDAGPNVHLLYPDEIRTQVQEFIRTQLLPHCEDGQWIDDHVGKGPFRY
ncbi:MAG: diphosphomevalonate decarboxylase [Bacteroidales bacterium]|nr:diphosphomevalonate decarboxylase [Bacteroidales bacterium]